MSLFKVKTKHELDMEKGFIQGPQKNEISDIEPF